MTAVGDTAQVDDLTIQVTDLTTRPGYARCVVLAGARPRTYALAGARPGTYVWVKLTELVVGAGDADPL